MGMSRLSFAVVWFQILAHTVSAVQRFTVSSDPLATYTFTCSTPGTKCVYDKFALFSSQFNPTNAGPRLKQFGIFLSTTLDLELSGCQNSGTCGVLCSDGCTCTKTTAPNTQGEDTNVTGTASTSPCEEEDPEPDDHVGFVEHSCDVYNYRLTYDRVEGEPLGYEEYHSARGPCGQSTLVDSCPGSSASVDDVGFSDKSCSRQGHILCCVHTHAVGGLLGTHVETCSTYCTKDMFPGEGNPAPSASPSASSAPTETPVQPRGGNDPNAVGSQLQGSAAMSYSSVSLSVLVTISSLFAVAATV